MFIILSKTLSATSTVFDRRDFINEACYMKQFQSYHLVRLFGVVSKGSPSSAVGNQKKIYFTFQNFLSQLRILCSRSKVKKSRVPTVGGNGDELDLKISTKSSESQNEDSLQRKRYGRPPGESLADSEKTGDYFYCYRCIYCTLGFHSTTFCIPICDC